MKEENNNKKVVKDKPKKISLGAKAKYKAKKDCLLPLFYRGKIVRISDSEQVELESKELSYESKVELIRSIKNGHVIVG